MFPIKRKIAPAQVEKLVSGLALDAELSRVCDRRVYVLPGGDVVLVSPTGKGLVGARDRVFAWVAGFSEVSVPDTRDTFMEYSVSGDGFIADAVPGCARVLQRAWRLAEGPDPLSAVRLFDIRWSPVFERRVLRRTPLFDAVVALVGEAAIHVLEGGVWRMGVVCPGVRHPVVDLGERVFDPIYVLDRRADRGLGYSIEAELGWNAEASEYVFEPGRP